MIYGIDHALPMNEWGLDVVITKSPLPIIGENNTSASILEHVRKGARVGIIVPKDDTPLFAEDQGWLEKIELLQSLSCLPEKKLLFIELENGDPGKRNIYSEFAHLWASGGGIPIYCQSGRIEEEVRRADKFHSMADTSIRRRWQKLAEEIGGVVKK